MNYSSVWELHLPLLWESEASPSSVSSKRCMCQHIFNLTLWDFFSLNCISMAGCKLEASFPSCCKSTQLFTLMQRHRLVPAASLTCGIAPTAVASEPLLCGCIIAEVVQMQGSRWSTSLLLGIGCACISAGISASELVSPSWPGSLNVMCDSEHFQF